MLPARWGPQPATARPSTRPESAAGAAPACANTAHRFLPGDRIRLVVTPGQDAHVYCYVQDETRRIQSFYPSRFSKTALVKAAEPLETRFELVAKA